MAETKKKSTTKKAATKKVADKPAPAKAKKPFNLLSADGDALVASFAETMASINSVSKKRKLRVGSLVNHQQPMLEIPHMLFEYLFASKWIRAQTIIELIGSPGMGKTTLCMWFIGHWMRSSSALPFYLETENKPLTSERIKRALGADKKTSERCLNLLQYAQVFNHVQLMFTLDKLSAIIRGKAKNGNKKTLPMDIPVIGLVDTVSKVASKDEAIGVAEDLPELMESKLVAKKKDVGETNPLVHGKFWMQAMAQAPAKMSLNNLTYFFVSHQNDHIDMSGSGSNLPKQWLELRNKTRRGARALNQSAAYQLIGIKGNEVVDKNKNKSLGHWVIIRMDKDTFGPENRQIKFILRSEDVEDDDTDDTYASPFMMDAGFCDILEAKGILGVKLEDKNSFLYSSRTLGLTLVPASDIYEAIINDPAMRARVGKALKIEGYSVAEAEKGEAPPPPPTGADFVKAAASLAEHANTVGDALKEAVEHPTTEEEFEVVDDDLGVEAEEAGDED